MSALVLSAPAPGARCSPRAPGRTRAVVACAGPARRELLLAGAGSLLLPLPSFAAADEEFVSVDRLGHGF